MKLQILTTLALMSLSSVVIAGSILPTAKIRNSAIVPQPNSQTQYLVYSEIEINFSVFQEYSNTVEWLQYKDIRELLDELYELYEEVEEMDNLNDLLTITVKPGKALDDLTSWLNNHPGANTGITITQPVFNPNNLTCCEAIDVYHEGNMSQERAMGICGATSEDFFLIQESMCAIINNM